LTAYSLHPSFSWRASYKSKGISDISVHAVLTPVIDGHIHGGAQSAIHPSVISPVCFVLYPLICSTFT